MRLSFAARGIALRSLSIAMLAAAARRPSLATVVLVHRFATEPVAAGSNSHSSSPPPPLPTSKPRSHLYPHPRPAKSQQLPRNSNLPRLPPTFGRNQLLPVTDATRALLEDVVAKFNAPIRYAFAYGSGVFEQDGREQDAETPMLDFMFAVTHPAHFHYINMQQYPAHYPMHARMLGSSYVERVEDIGPGVWFNAYVPMNGKVSYLFRLFLPVHLFASLLSGGSGSVRVAELTRGILIRLGDQIRCHQH